MVEITVDNEMLNDMEPLDSETAGAMKPAATQAMERRSSEFARSLVRSLCTSVTYTS